MADGHAKHHDYHLVNPSPWPLVGSVAAFMLAVGAIVWMKTAAAGSPPLLGMRGPVLFACGMALVLFTMFMWWRDVINEAHAGDHTPVVSLHLRYGMIMFIASEVMFFVAWFWAYFDASLFPAPVYPLNPETTNAVVGMTQRAIETSGVWPPKPRRDSAP